MVAKRKAWMVAAAAVAALCTAASLGLWADEVGSEIYDGEYVIPALQRNGEPMPREQVARRGQGNIVALEFIERQVVRVHVDGPIQDGVLGLNVDPDGDGQGDYWGWFDPRQFGAQVVLFDGYFVRLGAVDAVIIDEQTMDIPVFELLSQVEDVTEEWNPSFLMVSFDPRISELIVGDEVRIGEPIEIVPLHTASDTVLLEWSQIQQQQQQQYLKDKYCPPRCCTVLVDADGDGFVDDHYYRRNTVLGIGFDGTWMRIELYCLSGTTFGKRVVHGNGVSGWIGKCPYVGGRNYQRIDRDPFGRIFAITREIIDGGADDDGDGKLDSTVYRYAFDLVRGRWIHTSTHYEDGVPVQSSTKLGPYPTPALPFWP